MAKGNGGIPWPAWVAVTILVAIIGAYATIKSRESQPQQSPPPISKQPSSPLREPESHRPKPTPIGGPISVNVNNDPRVIPPGGRTVIAVLATASDGSVIPNARVVLSAGGGVFDETGATKVVGSTNDKGAYSTTWRTYAPNVYTGDMSYEIRVEVIKEGFTQGRGETEVFVRR